ncbi:MAG TPA: hypothetical protein VM328_02700 [Fimbriimonadaceae bacterium]|nr:hypothetical protein [Fimbriimonadaceae bacterium]
MATNDPAAKRTIGERLQSVNRLTLYGILIVLTSVPHFFHMKMPNKPVDATMDLFRAFMNLPQGSTVLIQTDWTTSTRGESGGQMEALLRILMRKEIKFAIFSCADPQAPQVARNVIASINAERRESGERPWDRWNDWIDLGYFPNAEGTNNAIATNLRQAFAGREDVTPEGVSRDVFRSPVLSNVRNVKDLSMYIIVTASATFNVAVERLSKVIPMGAMVTGVMGPESLVYYESGQIVGLSAGLKGVYDLETMMEAGVNVADPAGHIAVRAGKFDDEIRAFPGAVNEGKGTSYYPTLHFAIGLMVLAIIVGNIGMFLSRRRRA